MQVFLQIVAFSLQTDGRPVRTKGKSPKERTGMLTVTSKPRDLYER